MAIPSGMFANQVGLALMRLNNATSEWFFVNWILPGADFVYDQPGVGSWTYQIWAVIGFQVNGGGASITATGKENTIIITNLKR